MSVFIIDCVSIPILLAFTLKKEKENKEEVPMLLEQY